MPLRVFSFPSSPYRGSPPKPISHAAKSPPRERQKSASREFPPRGIRALYTECYRVRHAQPIPAATDSDQIGAEPAPEPAPSPRPRVSLLACRIPDRKGVPFLARQNPGHFGISLGPATFEGSKYAASLFDDFVRLREQRGWRLQAKRLRRLEIQDQLKLRRLFYR